MVKDILLLPLLYKSSPPSLRLYTVQCNEMMRTIKSLNIMQGVRVDDLKYTYQRFYNKLTYSVFLHLTFGSYHLLYWT